MKGLDFHPARGTLQRELGSTVGPDGSDRGVGRADVPGLPNIQALKPATKKKIMSATVATAKLWSARRHPSDDLVRCLARKLDELDDRTETAT